VEKTYDTSGVDVHGEKTKERLRPNLAGAKHGLTFYWDTSMIDFDMAVLNTFKAAFPRTLVKRKDVCSILANHFFGIS
jgi:hypothetical protein